MSAKRPAEATRRSSTRSAAVSKAFRIVDSETRREFKDKRIQALEADNYVENENQDVDDDAYNSEEDEKSSMKKKKQKSAKGSTTLSKWYTRKVKPFERLQIEEGLEGSLGPNYFSANASNSTRPSRHFCSVCGYIGQYTCTRCGLRFCSIKCNVQHKETRCMKFSL